MSLKPRARRGLAGALTAALVGPGLVALAAAPAHAESVEITDAQFRWGLNDESNNAAYYPGSYNFFSAGKIGNPGAGGKMLNSSDEGATWNNGATAGWSATDGNVTIEKEQSDGSYATATWAGLKTDPDGNTVTVAGSTFTDHQVVIGAGTGTLDPESDDADITWDGDFTALYYSGMTYFTVSDPHLVVEDGQGEITATLGGYATSMDDMTQWDALPDTEVTLASLSDVDVTEDGIEVTPDYVGVAYDAPDGATEQTAQTDDNASYWGSFPQSFVDFQQLTGSSSYWYSSGGSADTRKPTLPLEVLTEPVPAKQSSQVGVTLKAAAYGKASTVTATVTPTATGKITLKDGSKSLGSKTLSGGKATFTLAKTLKPGTHTLTASYAGNDTVAASSATKKLTVAKAASTTKVSWKKKPKAGKAASLKVSVTGPAAVAKPTGTVTAKVTRGAKSVSVKGTLKSGTVRLALSKAKSKKLGKGSWKATVKYAGSAYFKASTKKLTTKVK
ncbi:MAG: Ig-like domain-containing protein [Nocardioides sp.]|uniref:Ig-like domain-containing protein n=1 Tax=Nocardioides sp. TaxID=35761 RepID=UPI0039E5A79D